MNAMKPLSMECRWALSNSAGVDWQDSVASEEEAGPNDLADSNPGPREGEFSKEDSAEKIEESRHPPR